MAVPEKQSFEGFKNEVIELLSPYSRLETIRNIIAALTSICFKPEDLKASYAQVYEILSNTSKVISATGNQRFGMFSSARNPYCEQAQQALDAASIKAKAYYKIASIQQRCEKEGINLSLCNSTFFNKKAVHPAPRLTM